MPEPDAPLPADPGTLAFERIVYAKDPGSAVATVTISRPAVLNCFDFRTLRELGRAFEDAGWDDSVATVVITGAGDRAFCTGADLHDRLRSIGKPTIARINGVCVGGGQELQLACDLSVMVDDAYIQHVGPEHGSVPAGGATQWLPLVVGDRRAREIIMLCERISPQQALEWGLVSRVVPRSALDSTVAGLAEQLRNKLPETMRYTKAQLNWWRDLVWSSTISHARDWLAVHSTSDETREAVVAFGEKRSPRFDELRSMQAAGGRSCSRCGARGLPAGHGFCGVCGSPLGSAWGSGVSSGASDE